METNYKYKKLSDFKKAYPNDYHFLYRNGLIKQLCDDMGWVKKTSKPPGYWTKERCIEEAKKYKSVSEWDKSSKSSYVNSYKTDWYDECIKHMVKKNKPSGYWDIKKNCLEDALKYTEKYKWQLNSSGAYRNSQKNGWFDECVAHMCQNVNKTKKPHGYWTKERCIKESKKYKTLTQLRKENCSLCRLIIKNNWVNECTTVMDNIKK